MKLDGTVDLGLVLNSSFKMFFFCCFGGVYFRQYLCRACPCCFCFDCCSCSGCRSRVSQSVGGCQMQCTRQVSTLHFLDPIVTNRNKTRRSTMRPQATFSFFIFLQVFHFFTLLIILPVPPSSSLLPPRPSFLLVPPSSSSLFLTRPALSKSFRIRESLFHRF